MSYTPTLVALGVYRRDWNWDAAASCCCFLLLPVLHECVLLLPGVFLPIIVLLLVSPPGGWDVLALSFQPPYLHAVHGLRASGHEVRELNHLPLQHVGPHLGALVRRRVLHALGVDHAHHHRHAVAICDRLPQ